MTTRLFTPITSPRISVRVDGGPERVVEFPLGSDRAFSIGSAPCADLRLEGVPHVFFYFERQGSCVWFVPALRSSSLFVGGRPAEAPCPILGTLWIEFSASRMVVSSIDAAPARPAGDAGGPPRTRGPAVGAGTRTDRGTLIVPALALPAKTGPDGLDTVIDLPPARMEPTRLRPAVSVAAPAHGKDTRATLKRLWRTSERARRVALAVSGLLALGWVAFVATALALSRSTADATRPPTPGAQPIASTGLTVQGVRREGPLADAATPESERAKEAHGPVEAGDPVVEQAVDDLASGRRARALQRYQSLAERYPKRPVFRVVAKALAREAR